MVLKGETDEPRSMRGNANLPSTNSLTIGREEFEQRVVKCFEKRGIGYAGLMEIQSEIFENTYRGYADEVTTFEQAVTLLFKAYEASRGRDFISL